MMSGMALDTSNVPCDGWDQQSHHRDNMGPWTPYKCEEEASCALDD